MTTQEMYDHLSRQTLIIELTLLAIAFFSLANLFKK